MYTNIKYNLPTYLTEFKGFKNAKRVEVRKVKTKFTFPTSGSGKKGRGKNQDIPLLTSIRTDQVRR